MSTIQILDANGDPQTAALVESTGQAAEADSLPVVLTAAQLAAIASQTTSAAILAKLSADPATQTTLAAILAKLIAAPATEAKQDTLIGHVDGVGSSLSSILAKIIAAPATEAKQDAAKTVLDNILAKIIAAPATSAKQDDILTALGLTNGYVDGIEPLLTAVSGKLPGTLGAKTGANSLSVVPATDALYVLADTGYRSQPTVNRAANTIAYAAGDVVGGVIEFTLMGPAGRHMMLTSLDLRYNVAALPSGMGGMRLHLYGATPPSAYADNDPWDLPSGDRSAYIGYVDLGTLTDLGSTLFAQADGVNKHMKLGVASTSFWGYLVTLAGPWVPAGASEILVPTMRAIAL